LSRLTTDHREFFDQSARWNEVNDLEHYAIAVDTKAPPGTYEIRRIVTAPKGKPARFELEPGELVLSVKNAAGSSTAHRRISASLLRRSAWFIMILNFPPDDLAEFVAAWSGKIGRA